MAQRKKSDDGISTLHAYLRVAGDDERRLAIYVEFLRSPGTAAIKAQLREADTALLIKKCYMYPVLAGTIRCLRARLRASDAVGDDKGASRDLADARSNAKGVNSLEVAQLKVEIAQLYEDLRRYDDAVDIYEEISKAEVVAPRVRAPQRDHDEWENRLRFRADAFYRLGNIRLQQGAFGEALGMHQQAYDLRENLGQPAVTAVSLAALARVHAGLGDTKSVRTLLARSLDAARACAEGSTVARPVAESFEHMAEAELMLGHMRKAGDHITFARMLFQQLNDDIGVARMHVLDGRICEAGLQFREATQHYASAYRTLDACGAWRSLPPVLIAIGRAQRSITGQTDKSRFPLLEALRFATEAQDVRARCNALMELSTTFEQLGRWREALEHYKAASTITLELGNEQHRRATARLQSEFDINSARNLEDQLRKAQRSAGRGRQEVRVATTRLGVQLERSRALQRDLKSALRAHGDRDMKRLKSVLEKMTRELKEEFTDDDELWHNLLKRVIDVDRDFMECLHEKYPTLTNAELEVCGLEVLGRSASEIAGARGSKLKTIYKQRQLIRRKTECPRAMNLGAYLKSICK
ncbi:MAG: tetratricopeptide repeat protein [Bacteroidota bacterium]